MQRLSGAILGAMILATAAHAEGFAINDLTQVEVDTEAFATGSFETLPKRDRLMVACLECTRTAVVNLKLETAEPETEANLRDGTMSADILQEACNQAEGSVTCLDVDMVQVGEAVGWVTRTMAGEERHLRTYELYLGGKKLNVQAIAETREEADDIGSTAFETIVPRIVTGNES